MSYFVFQVCYYNQVTSGVLPYVAGNLAGWSKSMEETASACTTFLERDTPHTLNLSLMVELIPCGDS